MSLDLKLSNFKADINSPIVQRSSRKNETSHSSTSATPEFFAENFEQLTGLLTSARRSIDIASPNLEPALFDRTEVVSALSGLARRSRQPHIRILVADDSPQRLERHRLVALTRRLTSSVSLHVLSSHPEWQNETLVIADRRQALTLKPAQNTRTLVDNPISIVGWADKFDRLWHASTESRELRAHY
ncbi:hypothetical protein N9V92_04195 [Luminiphilus sp.]|nr:hypothetical protein [Luminiphilus sp.]